jgi:hypothetical protein
LGQLIDTVVHPDEGTDRDLGEAITKVKVEWHWAPAEGPVSANPQITAVS